jgi:hypothetical protein
MVLMSDYYLISKEEIAKVQKVVQDIRLKCRDYDYARDKSIEIIRVFEEIIKRTDY